MWFEQSNEIFEVVRSSVFAYLIVVLPIFVSISPSCLGAREFPAFRLQQFELHGSSYGSSGSLLNLETRILPGSPIVSSPRRCYVVKLVDFTISTYRELLRHSVAGIIIIVPTPKECEKLSADLIEQIQELEQAMLEETTTVPVYFIIEDDQVRDMYETVKISAESLGSSSSGLQTILQHIHGNGVQVVASLGTPKVISESYITNIQGALTGTKMNKNFPILLSTYYDSMSPAPELSFGGDSNGSGVTVLLELARLFSHVYNQRGPSGSSSAPAGPRRVGTRPHNSLLFLLSGAGQFNYQGTQKYLEDQLESSDHSELQDTRLVICLDSLAANQNQIYIHVSRSIREGTMLNAFIKNLMDSASQLYPELKIEVVQRKVRSDSLLSWEHEKFHLKKINAITLSSHENSNNVKSSILDMRSSVNINDLAKKTHVIGEALASTLYNVSGFGSSFSGSLGVSKDSMSSLLHYLTSQPRSAQLLATKQNKFVQSLKSILGRYTHETSSFYLKPDKRDANLVFYDGTAGTITAYDVKPAVFDLLLSVCIAAYIGLVFLAIKNFPFLYGQLSYTITNNGVNGAVHASQAKSKAQ